MIPFLQRLAARLRAVFQKTNLDAELDEEMRHHLDMLTEENIARGMDPAKARRTARLSMGGIEQTRELHRETRGLPWLEQLGQDLRHTLRMLRRERGFALIAILVLAIGVGLNTTVFSLVNTVLLRPLPAPAADRLVEISNGDPANPDRDLSARTHRVDTWEGLIEQNRSFERIEYYDPFSLRSTFPLDFDGGTPQTSNLVFVSQGLFDLLGIVPEKGRLFLPAEGIGEGAPVLIITHQMWRQRFASDPDIIGRTVRINGNPVTIVGVMPPEDTFAGVFYPAVRIDAYAVITPDNRRTWGNTLQLIGRLKPDVTPEAARADLALAMDAMLTSIPDRASYHRANVAFLHDVLTARLRPPLLFLSTAAGLVLFIVAFNFGGLLLARGASRGRELAVRAALGAGRGRILRQLFTESAVIVTFGASAGIVLAATCVHLLSTRSAIAIPLLQGLQLDGAAVAFMAGISVLTAIVCGVGPAWSMSRVGSGKLDALQQQARGSTAGGNLTRLRSVLVITEVALAAALAVSAGLAVRSLQNVLQVDLGYNPQNLQALRIDVNRPNDQYNAYLDSLLDRVRAIPGVQSAGLTDCLPIERERSWGIGKFTAPFNLEQSDFTNARVKIITPGLLEAMGITLKSGRDFTRFDDEEHPDAIIINERLARRFFPEGEAVGQRLVQGPNSTPEIVGVVADTHHAGPESPLGREMYLPVRQRGGGSFDLMMRTTLPPTTLRRELIAALRTVDPTLPVTQLRPMTELVDRANSSRHVLTLLVAGFATIALGLAGLGLYGVIAYTVTQRTKEIGIRMALGAQAAQVRADILRRTLLLSLAGLGLGLIAAIYATRIMQGLLFGLSNLDPLTYAIAATGVLLCAVLAGLIPAIRASRVDPMVALRAD